MTPNPEILYKYRSLSEDSFKFTQDIFMKNELYFAHPDEVNDPFDCKIPPCLENVTKDKLLHRFSIFDQKQFECKGMSFKKCEEVIENTPLSVLQERLKKDIKSQRDVGILSLSEENLDILMWGHYADSHKGICIGFDYLQLSFAFRETPIFPEHVTYPEDNNFKWDPFEDEPIALVDKIYLTKALDWQYEKEWRVILPEQGRTPQKFNPNALASVYLGCQIDTSDKETIINWCLQRERRPKVYELTKEDASYTLKEKELSY